MKRIVEYFIKYPVWVRVILLFLTLFGLISLFSLKSSFFPAIDPRLVTISVTYPGASPFEVEEGAVVKIEDQIKGISGIDRISSTTFENGGTVKIEIKKGFDGEKVLQDVKNGVDQINTFPVDMEPVRVVRQEPIDEAISFALKGDVSLYDLKKTAQKIERDLLRDSHISLVSISGYPSEEIQILVREKDLSRFGLTIADVSNAVALENFNMTGGTLKGPQETLIIRSNQKGYIAKDIENIIVKSTRDGAFVRLNQVATVQDGWADNPARTYFNGDPAVTLTVSKTVDEDILKITEIVRSYIDTFNKENKSIQAVVTRDRSVVLQQRIKLLTTNGITGFILVILTLALFLNVRLSFWVACGIPSSFLGLFIAARLLDLTINVSTLFGMIIVVGILVDDAIVISENVYQHFEKGKHALAAAVDGTIEVLPSVVSSILTTVIAFTPFFFLDGRIADIFSNMAIVVILTLLISLLEGAFILPAHLAHSKALLGEEYHAPFRKKLDARLDAIRNKVYKPALEWVVSHRWKVLMVPIIGFCFMIFCFKNHIVKWTFFPFIDGDNIQVSVSMPAGTNEALTKRVLDKIEVVVWQVNTQFKSQRQDGKNVVENVIKQLGPEIHKGQLDIQLLDGETRNLESFYITQAIRSKIGQIPEAESIEFGGRGFFGKPVSIAFLGSDTASLDAAKDSLKAALSKMPALKDVVDDNQPGLKEIHIELKPAAHALGLNTQMILGQIRQSFFGQEVQRVQRGTDEVRVWVRRVDDERVSLGQLSRFLVRTPDGREIPFQSVATAKIERGTLMINRVDGEREVLVEADLSDQNQPVPPILDEIRTRILPEILKNHPDISVQFEGQKRETDKTTGSAGMVLPLVFLAMIAIIVLAFRSFSQAFLVVLIIPFGLMGVAFGHWFHNMPVSMLSVYGIIALIGIMVNDSIVFINSMNQFLREGDSFSDALLRTGLSRYRPILLTSLTTISGLAPLILEKSRQAQFLIPMAISVAYGLLFATFNTLLVLPALLSVANTVRRYVWVILGRPLPDAESVEPAIQELEFLNEIK